MTPAKRKQYLEALGITVWKSRGQSAAEQGEVLQPKIISMDANAVREPPITTSTPVTMQKMDFDNPLADMDWEPLAEMVKDCNRCRLRAGCTQTVFGVGARNASLLVVGEGPGADEDRIGQPFVGRAGKLLDSMLAAIGRSRQETRPELAVYIANIVKCRPPNNRDPEPDEAAACRGYLERQIALIRPRLILAVGRIAAQNLLGTEESLGKLRGRLHRHEATGTTILITYHPAFLLRSPRDKAKAWVDLKQARALLQG